MPRAPPPRTHHTPTACLSSRTFNARLALAIAEALLHAAKGLEGSLSADEAKEVEKYQKLLEDAAGGEFKVFKEGDDVDGVHWCAAGRGCAAARQGGAGWGKGIG